MAGVVGRESIKNTLETPSFINHTAQICPADFFTVALAQNRTFNALFGQVIVHRRLVFEVHLRLATADFVQRWLRDIEVTTFDQFGHLAEEEREQQRTNMRSVDVRVGHDDNLVVAQFFDVELVAPDARTKRHHEVADFL